MTLIVYALGMLLSFFAGYGAASLGILGINATRRRYVLEEMSADEVKSRTEVVPNVVKLTPREEATLRSFVSWQVDPDLLDPEKAGA